jgi:tetratricopeptide (TPR) repeat protein
MVQNRSVDRGLAIIHGLVFVVLTTHAAVAGTLRQSDRALECGGDERVVSELVNDTSPVIGVIGSNGAWVEVEEQGQNVDLAISGGIAASEIRVPPRFGWRVAAADRNLVLTIRRSEQNRARGVVRVTLHCARTPSRQVFDWFESAAILARKMSVPSDTSDLVANADLLARDAPDARTRALALHLAAQAAMLAEHSALASARFLQAEHAWDAIGDRDRAMAARVGRVEDLRRAGKFQDVLAIAKMPSRASLATSYFALRLVNSRCLTLRDVGRLAESQTCYEWTMRRLDIMDERIEYVNTLQNYAVVQMEQAHPDRAEAVARHALGLVSGPNADIVRGRIHLTLMRLALSRAEPAKAVAEANDALDSFAVARNARWEANTYLELAAVYRELGAYDEAYDAIVAAITRLSPGDAPARIAGALTALAAIDRQTGRFDDALHWIAEAEHLHASLGMPAEVATDKLASIRLRLAQGSDVDIVGDVGDSESGDEVERSLLDIEIGLSHHDARRAKGRLDRLTKTRLSLSDGVRFARLQANYQDLLGEPERAAEVRWRAAEDVAALAVRSRSRIMRSLLRRQLEPLRRDAFGRILGKQFSGEKTRSQLFVDQDIKEAWRWLALAATTDVGGFGHFDSRFSGADAFDSALANELLLPAIDNSREARLHSNTQRKLVALLAREAGAARPSSVMARPSLAAVQQAIEPGSLLLAHIDGGDRGALLLVSNASAWLVPATSLAELGGAGVSLGALGASRSTPVAEIDAAAKQISHELFGKIEGMRAPSKLFVLADNALDALPWPLLYWPGESGPLVETSAISLVRLTNRAGENSNGRLHVFLASQQNLPGSKLPALEMAGEEAEQIRQIALSQGIAVQNVGVSREAVLEAFEERGAWVHVAAHGVAMPRRMGYAGFWLDPRAGTSKPAFFSWLDVMGRGANSGLVVLDACQLGNGGDVLNGSIGFASSVSQAGAAQVVASLWSVSDAASASWVRAFYTAMGDNQERDAAVALQAAQIELRRSRMFRHPFYWAGWRSFSHLVMPSAPAKANVSPMH